LETASLAFLFTLWRNATTVNIFLWVGKRELVPVYNRTGSLTVFYDSSQQIYYQVMVVTDPLNLISNFLTHLSTNFKPVNPFAS